MLSPRLLSTTVTEIGHTFNVERLSHNTLRLRAYKYAYTPTPNQLIQVTRFFNDGWEGESDKL
jgi:hypothetical protein